MHMNALYNESCAAHIPKLQPLHTNYIESGDHSNALD